MEHHVGNSVAFLAVPTGAQHMQEGDSGLSVLSAQAQWEQFSTIIQVGLVIIKTASPTNERILK